MIEITNKLPRAAWARIIRLTCIVVLIATAVSLAVTFLILEAFGIEMRMPGVMIATAPPVLLGGPLVFFHLMRLAQLDLANQKLQILASTDWLTSCLNRGAFTSLVNGHLDDVPAGAFLVIDVDHFKIINDHYGHDRGDEVLQLMAATIRANVREGDLVGRLGGEEFGVFLKGANLETARRVAERIRRAVNTVIFAPDGRTFNLSVSVGGAFFDGAITFGDLFRIADQRLYGAKASGRNRVDVAPADDHERVGLAEPGFRWAAAGR